MSKLVRWLILLFAVQVQRVDAHLWWGQFRWESVLLGLAAWFAIFGASRWSDQ
jgi:hypothetical protein